MTYYINPIWFYLINLSTGIKIFIATLSIPLLAVSTAIILFIILEESDDITNLADNKKKTLKLCKKTIITGIILVFIGVLIPSKETCIEMMIASQVTHENVAATKKEIYEIVDYITDKVSGEKEE